MSTKARITVEHFLAMAARGDFDPIEENHVELVRGEIVPRFGDDPRHHRSPLHESIVDDLLEWSLEVVPRNFVRVRAQGAISIPALDSVPVLEIGWAARKDYHRAHPSPQDVFLLLDAYDPSMPKDRRPKLELFAEANIRDYWIVNVQGRSVDVYRDPEGLIFRSIATYHPGQEIHPFAFPDVSLAVSRLFPD